MIRQHSVQRPAAIPPDLWAERADSGAVLHPCSLAGTQHPASDSGAPGAATANTLRGKPTRLVTAAPLSPGADLRASDDAEPTRLSAVTVFGATSEPGRWRIYVSPDEFGRLEDYYNRVARLTDTYEHSRWWASED
jgi:hypothetical protein